MSTTDTRKRRRVLDAGCGRKSEFDFGDAHVVGIDVSELELSLNDQLDERIVGDIQTYPLEPESFDEIVCQDVLEHLPRPELALDNLVRALKPGGTLTLGVPHPATPKGLVAKLTPLRFHVWFLRRVFGSALAGKPGYGPYKTYLRWFLRPGNLRRFAAERGLEVVELREYSSDMILRFRALHPSLWRVAAALWRAATLGRDPAVSDVTLVLRKPARRAP